jgi:PAS domain S-box-containing protein
MTKDFPKEINMESKGRPTNRLFEKFRHWMGDWGGKLTFIFGALALTQLFCFRYAWLAGGYLDIVTDIIPVLIYFGAFLMALRVSRHRALPVRTRRAWRLLALAHLFYMAGSVLWAYFELFTHTKPFPSWADAAYLSYYPLMLSGLLLLVSKLQTLEERAKLALDAGIVTLGGGMLIWYFLLQPIAQAATGDRMMTVLSLAYPVSDIVLLFGISAVLLRRSSSSNRWALNFLLAGIVLGFIADLVFGYQNLNDTYQSGLGSYGLYTVSCFLVIVGSHHQYTRASFGIRTAAPLQKKTKSFIWLPYLAIALGYGLLLKFVYEQPQTLLSQLIAAAVVLTAFVVSRQVMAMRENAKGRDALRELQERFQGIYSASKDAIAFTSFDGTLVDVNDAYAELIGYSKEELLRGTKYQQLTAPEYHQFELEIRARVIELGQPAEYEKEAIRKDGSRVGVTLTTFAVRGNDGNPIGLASIIRDVTEQKRAEAERQIITEIVQGVITTTNLDELLNLAHRSIGKLLYAENCFVALRDATTDLLHFEFWIDKVDPVPPPQPVGKGFSGSSYVLRTGQPLLLTEELKTRLSEQGEVRLIGSDSPSWLGVPLRTPSRTIGVLVVQHYEKKGAYSQRDLEFLSSVGDQIALAIERKRAEAALRSGEERFQLVTRATNDAIWDWDLETNQVWWNEGFQTMFGYRAQEIEPGIESRMTRLHPDDSERVHHGICQALDMGQQGWSDEYRFRRADGSYACVIDRAYVVQSDGGKPVRMLGSMMDVTERKRMEGELMQARDAALESARIKSEFLANMSHEIRTPMNGIIGMTDLALDTKLSREQREYLGMVKSSAHSLLGLINDILDFSKMEAGKLELESISFSLRDCIGSTLKPLGVRAEQKELELVADIPADVPDDLIGDALRLRQIVVNLTDNAIKFSQRGEIVVKVSTESQQGAEHCLRFCVSDTGVGIPADKQALIFEAFAQADGSTTRTYGGTGLGLAIATRLIKQMRGRIWVESEVGKGTTFYFTACFGICKTPLSAVKEIDRSNLDGLRALIVDDNAVTGRILREMLTNWRMKPTVVESGAAALDEMRRAAEADQPFPLILLDAVMPEMDGFDLLEKIEEQPELASATVMMLSSAMPVGAVARCGELGVASMLTKPVAQSHLLDAIVLAMRSVPEDQPSSPAPAPNAAKLSNFRILLAEDNVINRAVATGILEKQGHTLSQAENGREAVAAVTNGNFDLVFMDVQMPEMDGLQATRRIREIERERGGHTRIIAMTAHAMAGDRERCLEAGMDGYISKPVKKEDLLNALRNLSRNNYEPVTRNGQITASANLSTREECSNTSTMMKNACRN